MRIISGIHKGKRLYPGKFFKARPTTDFAKENLFNVLSNYFNFNEVQVLDLFSGTGSISFEFASRGTPYVDSVEFNTRHHTFIRKTCTDLKFDQVVPLRADAFKFLKYTPRTYDIIFADPPFDLKDIDQLPHLVLSRNLLNAGGWFILEHGSDYDFSFLPYFDHIRKYGSVNFSIFVND